MAGLVTDSSYQQYIWYYSEYSDQKQDFRAVDTTDNPVYYDLLDGNYYVSIIDSNSCQANSDILGIVLSATNRESFYKKNIFPNPASDYLTILTEKVLHNVNIAIYNNKGQLITHLKSSLPGTIPLHNIPTGIYYLKFSVGKEYYMTKVVLD